MYNQMQCPEELFWGTVYQNAHSKQRIMMNPSPQISVPHTNHTFNEPD